MTLWQFRRPHYGTTMVLLVRAETEDEARTWVQSAVGQLTIGDEVESLGEYPIMAWEIE